MRSPGLYFGLSDLEYHGDKDWLSSSGIQTLLKPGGPARFKHWLDNGTNEHKSHYDEGHAVHAEVLGTGLEVVEIKAKDWKTKAAQEARDKAYAENKVPLLTSGVEMVRAIGKTIRSSPEAMAHLEGGDPEVSAYATDEAKWVQMRSRPDYLRQLPNGTYGVTDLKTTRSAAPAEFRKSAFTYGYPIQVVTYKRVLLTLGIEVSEFTFLAVEKEPPYLWSLHEVDPEDLELAERQVDRGIDIFAQGHATGEWPGYGTDINVMRMSRWARTDAEEALL